jgi:hypothetical protein
MVCKPLCQLCHCGPRVPGIFCTTDCDELPYRHAALTSQQRCICAPEHYMIADRLPLPQERYLSSPAVTHPTCGATVQSTGCNLKMCSAFERLSFLDELITLLTMSFGHVSIELHPRGHKLDCVPVLPRYQHQEDICLRSPKLPPSLSPFEQPKPSPGGSGPSGYRFAHARCHCTAVNCHQTFRPPLCQWLGSMEAGCAFLTPVARACRCCAPGTTLYNTVCFLLTVSMTFPELQDHRFFKGQSSMF